MILLSTLHAHYENQPYCVCKYAQIKVYLTMFMRELLIHSDQPYIEEDNTLSKIKKTPFFLHTRSQKIDMGIIELAVMNKKYPN